MSVEQHAEAAADEIGDEHGDPNGTPVEVIVFRHMQAAIDEATATSEHAQVGALLAKCGNYRVAEYESGWHAKVYLVGGGMGSSEFAYETQLAAIRAAVEAAEQGARE